MELVTLNDSVLTEPFTEMSVKAKVSSGFAQIDQRSGATTKLKVLAYNKDKTLVPGDFIYVNSDSFTTPWAKQIKDLAGVKCILVPSANILFAERASQDWTLKYTVPYNGYNYDPAYVGPCGVQPYVAPNDNTGSKQPEPYVTITCSTPPVVGAGVVGLTVGGSGVVPLSVGVTGKPRGEF